MLKGSGWRRADRRAVSGHLLFPPALAPPPRRDITGRQIRQVLAALAESWRRPGEVITTSPPQPQAPESALSSRNPILSPHWPAAVDGWGGGRREPIRKRDGGRNGCFYLTQSCEESLGGWGRSVEVFTCLGTHTHTHNCNKGKSMK